jgi:hypothetical protein
MRHTYGVLAFLGHAGVSGAGELHPRALSEPYVSLSTHTAPIIQSLSQRFPNVQRDRFDVA